MQTAFITIDNKQVYPILPFVLETIKTQYSQVVLYADNLPKKIQEYLTEVLGIKVYSQGDCIAYNYAVVIKDVDKDNVKLEVKDNKTYLYLAKDVLSAKDIQIIKLKDIKRYYLGNPVNNCTQLDDDAWIPYIHEVSSDWAKLYELITTKSLTQLMSSIHNDKKLAKIWDYIQAQFKDSKQEVFFENMDDYMIGFLLVAIFNRFMNSKLKVGIENEFKCVPYIEEHALHCDLYEEVANIANIVEQSNSNDVDGQVNEQDNVKDITENDNNKASGDNKDDYVNEDRQNDEVNKEENKTEKSDDKSDNTKDNSDENTESAETDEQSADEDKPEDGEIDVEEWAERIQQMLDS